MRMRGETVTHICVTGTTHANIPRAFPSIKAADPAAQVTWPRAASRGGGRWHACDGPSSMLQRHSTSGRTRARRRRRGVGDGGTL